MCAIWRGPHVYYRPPADRTPSKVQLDESGVTVSSDGYLVGAGALHPTGHVYEYVRNGAVAELPTALYDRIAELGEQTRERTWRSFETASGSPSASETTRCSRWRSS